MTKKNRKLAVKITFEPNRFKNDCLVTAYEVVLPIIKRRIDLENEIQEFNLIKIKKIRTIGEL